MNTNHTETLVINWHITEVCNYSCHYCYAAWKKPDEKRELFHDSNSTKKLLLELYNCIQFQYNKLDTSNSPTYKKVRLNFAGGEPLLLSKKLLPIMLEAKKIGFDVSIITNGSLLTEELMAQMAPLLTWFGISIDSTRLSSNHLIGRHTTHQQKLDVDRLLSIIDMGKQANPHLKIKLNTVVNAINVLDDLSDIVERLAPQKWKVLQMLPIITTKNVIDEARFEKFIARHHAFQNIICAEKNDDMRNSYLMIDPHGRFFQNSLAEAGSGYVYSSPILSVGASLALQEIQFSTEKFNRRYASNNAGGSCDVL
ncbi:MAG: viperin family antiviral radical SAM protein [Paraglaciecola sp.]|nr:viperin family antiviral radical SAM protein [Paraglaciecola sp.]